MPVITPPSDSFTVAGKTHTMTFKTLLGDVEKIGKIQVLIEQHVEVDRLLAKLGVSRLPPRRTEASP